MRSGEIDPATRAELDEHLAGCSECKARLAPAAIAMPGSAAVRAVLFPEEIAGVPRGWVYTVVSLGSATLALSIVVLYLMGRPATATERAAPAREVAVASREEPAQAEPSRPEPTPAPAPAEAPAAAAPSTAEPSAVPQPAPPAATEAASARTGSPQPRQTPSPAAPKAPTRDSGAREAPAAAAPPAPEKQAVVKAEAPASAPSAPSEPPPKPKDEIEKLLFEATPTSTAPPPVKEEKSGDEPTGLTRSQVMEVMNSLQDKVHECATQTGKSGTVQVTATVMPTGRVKSVRVAGMFAGTPAGDCVAGAVRGAVFPTFVGSPQPVNYPVPLR